MHVSLHEFCDDVDILVTGLVGRLRDIQDLDDVLVIEELEQSNLSHDTLGIDKIFESFRDFLDGNFLVRLMIISTADDTVGAMANLLDVLIVVVDTEGRAGTHEFLLACSNLRCWLAADLLLEGLHLLLKSI